MGTGDQRPNDDIEKAMEIAKDFAFQEPSLHFPLNPLSALQEPRRHIKRGLRERIRELMGAYISLATFVEDEEIFAIMEKPKKSSRIYKRVMKNMDANEKEIKDFFRRLAE